MGAGRDAWVLLPTCVRYMVVVAIVLLSLNYCIIWSSAIFASSQTLLHGGLGILMRIPGYDISVGVSMDIDVPMAGQSRGLRVKGQG